MGRSCACKFLFGEETISQEKDKIESALDSKVELKTELFFYKKDGNSFKCLLDIVPIKNEKSQVVLILVSHKDVGDKPKSEETEDKSSSENDSDEEMAEAYRRCQARRGRATGGALPGTAGYNNQRRRSRAVLYHLSGQFEKQNRAKSKLQQFNKFSSISGKMPEYKVQEVKKSKFILVHYGIFKIGWDWLILLCTFYTAILVPFNAAFARDDKKNQKDSIYADVVVEVLFIFDILFNFRTSFVNKSGQVVYQARLIAINYIRGWFLLDLLAAIPFDFLYVFNISAKAPVHLLKLARLLRLARLLQKIDRFSQYSALVLALLMSMFTLLAHWLACLWYAIGHEEYGNNITAGWLSELSERLDLNPGFDCNGNYSVETVKPDVMISYLSALYFTCSSLTSVGFGNVSANTNSEKIFSICAMIIGALMHAVVFGNVTALIQRMYQRRANFHSKTKDLKDFFRAYDIPKPLKQRMQEYFQTMWSMNNGIETNEILKDFPEEMKGELGLHLHKEILNLSIFEEATQGCLKSIALHTRRSFCAPGEFLVHKGDAANYLYLLVSGSMEILKMDMVVAILGKGDLFGADIDFDDPVSVCNYDVRSLTYSELQCINIKGLTDVLLLYPEFAEKFAKDIHNDLTYNLRQTGEDSDEDVSSSPKARVCTLPSISEDDELSCSDDEAENSKSGDKFPDDDDQQETTNLMSVGYQSSSSPLLPVFRQKMPNGDIPMEVLNSPPSSRNWGTRRVSGISGIGGISRSSIKETRKLRLGHQADTISADKISPHIQSLQNEVEGTKTAISKLERKVTKIGQDICAIDRNMREILKHITNVSKMSPLEPLPPPTPCTPFMSKTQFHFDYSESDTIAPQRDILTDVKETESAESESRQERAVEGLPPSPRVSSANLFRSINRTSFRINTPNEHDKNSEIPLLLNPHDPLARRHSDGPERRKFDKGENCIPSAKSDYSLRDSFNKHKKQMNHSKVDHEIAEPNKCTSNNVEEFPKLCTHDTNNPTIMTMLEEVHSNGCSSTMDPFKKRSKTDENLCDKAKVKLRDRKVRKSVTCGNIKVKPNLIVDTGERKVTNCLETEITLSPIKTMSSEGLVSEQSSSRTLFDVGSKNHATSSLSPTKSKSYHEMTSKPRVLDLSTLQNRAKSYDIIETEFGASTPNEVKTTLFRTKSNNNNLDNSKCMSNDTLDSVNIITNLVDDEPFVSNDTVVLDDTGASDDVYKTHSLDYIKSDSGNVSLMDTTVSDIETGNNVYPDKKASVKGETQICYNNIKHTNHLDIANQTIKHSTDTPEHIDNHEINTDISPDSITDVSESLKTDSVKTEDETVIDVETGLDAVNVSQSVDLSLLRSTNL